MRNDIEGRPAQTGETAPDYLAIAAQFFGDFLADTKPTAGNIIRGYIVGKSDYQSTSLSSITGGVGIGDLIDGRAVRFATERLGTETTPDGARKDDLSDKEWAKKMLEAFITRSSLNKDYGLALFLLASKTIIDTRDGIVTELRDKAQELDVDVRAGPWGKRKTGLQNAAFTLQTSKLAQTKRGRKAFYAAQTGATVLSGFAGYITARKLKKGIARAKAEKGLA